jgi:hypothetical protein
MEDNNQHGKNEKWVWCEHWSSPSHQKESCEKKLPNYLELMTELDFENITSTIVYVKLQQENNLTSAEKIDICKAALSLLDQKKEVAGQNNTLMYFVSAAINDWEKLLSQFEAIDRCPRQ